jgi:hypothetical protein
LGGDGGTNKPGQKVVYGNTYKERLAILQIIFGNFVADRY